MWHPGNVTLRQIIRSKIENGDYDRLKKKTRKLINEAIRDMHAKHESDCRNGMGGMQRQNPPIRLLEWNEVRKDAWKEIPFDEDVLYGKLRQIVKQIEKSVNEERKKTMTKKSDGMVVPDENLSSIDLGSATSIFLSQDFESGPCFCGSSETASSSSAAALRAVKKQKLDIDGNGKTTLDAGLDPLECFGRKFLPLQYTPMVVGSQSVI